MLARDRLGVKPLYYAERGDLLVFASELKSLLASGLVEPELDYEAIDAYLAFGFVPGPADAARGRVEARCRAARSWSTDGGVRIGALLALPAAATARPRPSLDECAEELLAQLEESVRLRLMSDVPLGAMLSGGLDSSLIVALMARQHDASR